MPVIKPMRNIKKLLHLDLEEIITNALLIEHEDYSMIKDCIYLQLDSTFLQTFDKLLMHFSNGVVSHVLFITHKLENNNIEDIFQLLLKEYGVDFMQGDDKYKRNVNYGWCFKDLSHKKTNYYNPYSYGIFLLQPSEFCKEKSITLEINRYDSLEQIPIEKVK